MGTATGRLPVAEEVTSLDMRGTPQRDALGGQRAAALVPQASALSPPPGPSTAEALKAFAARATDTDDDLALGGSRHVTSALMRDSLLSMQTMRATETPVIQMLPFIQVVKIGGRSIIDGGRQRLYPVVEELAENLDRHKLVIGTGAGLRTRHVFSVGLDLGLPTGVLATLASADAEQNAHILAALMAKYGVVGLPHAQLIHFLPAILALGRGAIFNGVPPFDLWEHPARIGKIPPNRTDVGVYQLAEVYGARGLIYIKDEDGLYTADPKTDPKAEFIPRITVAELQRRQLRTLIIDRLVLELIGRGKHVRQLQIINGLKAGMITRALAGEHVGTIIEA